MPRIQCPKHKDCFIECPGSGYAFYDPPYGPCEKGCHPSKAGEALIKIIFKADPNAEFSGTVFNIPASSLANFAREFAKRAPSVAAADIAYLRNIDAVESVRTITAFWEDVDIAGVINALAKAARNTEDPGQKAA